MKPQPKDLLLYWFDDDELEECKRCGNRHLLPDWGSAYGRMCTTCGLLGLAPPVTAQRGGRSEEPSDTASRRD